MRLSPERNAVFAPVAAIGPSWQRFARIPFPWSEMKQAARRKAIAQPAQQRVGADAFCRPLRGRVPFGGVAVVDADEGRLAPHRQAHVVGLEVGIDRLPELIDRLPLLLGV